MEKDKNYDLELAKCIWSVLKYSPPAPMSWGVDLGMIKVIDRGLQFYVQGFLLTRSVVITYDKGTDYFDVTFHRDGSPKEVRVYNNVTLDGLADLIGSEVEKTNEYKKRVSDICDT